MHSFRNFSAAGRSTAGAALWATLCLSVIALVGCASATDEATVRVQDASAARVAVAQDRLRGPQTRPAYVLEEQIPRFAKRTVAVEQSTPLPAVGVVTARYSGRHTLLSVADIVTRLSGIPVVVAPDALLPASQFAPAGGGVGAAPAARGNAGEALPGASIKNLANDEYQSTFELNYSGQLAGLLDSIAKRGGLQWRYDAGTITISRVVSRTFSVKALSGGLKTSGSLKLNPADSGSSMDVELKSDADLWVNLKAALEALVSKGGALHIDQNTGIVSVRDAVPNVREVQRYIENLNTTALRQVVMSVEVLQVDLDDKHQRGVDWSYVSQALASAGDAVIKVNGPASLVASATSGGIGLTLSSANSSTGATGQALVSALEEFGRVSSSYSSVVTTTNRMPVPIGVLNQVSYLKSVTPGVSATGVGATAVMAPTLTPGQLSTGFAMTLTPLVLDSNRVLIQAALSISRLRNMATFTTGSGLTQASIQIPDVDVFNTLQRANLVPGETLVLAGYESEMGMTQGNDLVRDAVPGSRVSRTKRTSTVVLVTPRLMDI